MRVIILLATLALATVMVILTASAYTVGNLGSYMEAQVRIIGDRYYLVLNVTNPLPTPIVITVSQDGTSQSISLAPYGHGSAALQLTSLTMPIYVTVSIPGIANVTTTVVVR
jgi:hypothetical protein